MGAFLMRKGATAFGRLFHIQESKRLRETIQLF